MSYEVRFAEKFWARVDQSGECWLWTGAQDKKGYGSVRYRGKTIGPHRAAWMLTSGKLLKGCLGHCRKSKACVRPEHLKPGGHHTERSNLSQPFPPGENNPGAKLTEAQVREIRRRREEGESVLSISVDYSVSVTAIYSILNKHNWGWVK